MAAEDPTPSPFDDLLDRALRGEEIDLEQALSDHPDLTDSERRQLRDLCGKSAGTEGDSGDLPPPTDAPPIDRIGSHRLLHRIGAGAMGAVFLATDEALGRDVAIKILGPDILGTGERASRFLREVRAAARLRHPNIVAVHSAGEQNGLRYMVMEFVPGASLQELMADPASRGFRRPVSDVVRWGTELARALAAAHEAGIVHRDVKPSNIRIADDRRAVLLDFGLARDRDDVTLTETGSFRGSPQYASPEQVDSGKRSIDARSDVYSLGATLYEVLTGVAPFRGETREQVFHNILTRDPAPLRRIDPSIPRDLETVVLAALEKDPARRPQTAAALADDLQAISEGRPVSVRPPSPMGRVARWARRHPARAGLALALAVSIPAIAALLGFVLAKLPKIQKAESDERARELAGLVETGFLDFGEGERGDAQKRFEQAMAMSPESPEARAGFALARIEQGDQKGAIAFLDAQPDKEQYWNRRLRAAAMRYQTRGVELIGQARIREVEAIEQALGPPRTALDQFVSGYVELQFTHDSVEGHADQAFLLCRNAVLTSPSAVRLYYFELGHAAMHAKRHDEAREITNAIEVLWPPSPERWFAMGRTLLKADPPAARRLLAKAANPPTRSETARDSIVIALSEGDAAERDRAVAIGRDNVGQMPDRPNAHHALAIALLAEGDKAGALQSFREVVRLNPRYSPAHQRIYEILEAQGDVEGAIAAARLAVYTGPASVKAWISLGNALMATESYEEAISSFERALKLEPENPSARCNIGTSHMRNGDFVKGLENLREGHELGLKSPRWPYPSAKWIQDAERLVAEEERLVEIRAGKGKPAVPREQVYLAMRVCRLKKLYAEAAQLYATAFEREPELLEQRERHYCVSCAAAVAFAAGCGKGKDAPAGAAERAALRNQAREWFAREVSALEELSKDESRSPALRGYLERWYKDPALAAVRPPSEFAGIPPDEAEAWRECWARATALLRSLPASRPAEAVSR